jgi:hypothetical protein
MRINDIKWLFVVCVLAIFNFYQGSRNINLSHDLEQFKNATPDTVTTVTYVTDTINLTETKYIRSFKRDTVFISDTTYVNDTVRIVEAEQFMFSSINSYFDSIVTVIDTVYVADNDVKNHIQVVNYQPVIDTVIIERVIENPPVRPTSFLRKIFCKLCK